MRSGWCFAVVVVLGCSSGQVDVRPAPTKPAVQAVVPVQPVASVSASAAPRVPPPPPMAPPANVTDPTQQADFRMLSTLCEPAVVETKPNQPALGCACCPPFDACKAVAGQTLSTTKDAFYAANSIVYGSFTGPDRDEVAISMNGCESHAENYGGLIVAERENPGWRLVRYESGIHPDRMKSYRLRDRHDLLVCDWIDTHQTIVERLFTRDLALAEDKLDPLYEVGDNIAMSCAGMPPGAVASANHIDDISFRDVNHDGIEDLVLRVHVAESKETPAFKARCKKLFAALDKNEPAPSFADVMTNRDDVLWFLSDGRAFSRSPAKQPAPQSAHR